MLMSYTFIAKLFYVVFAKNVACLMNYLMPHYVLNRI